MLQFDAKSYDSWNNLKPGLYWFSDLLPSHLCLALFCWAEGRSREKSGSKRNSVRAV
jgi:hypothetical protein